MWIERKMKEENKMNYNLVNFCEFDKYAVKSYCAIHNVDEGLNLGDITKVDIDSLPVDVDLITSGSPCQSFSVAGKQHGGVKGSGTRSSLLWNHVEVVRHCKPKFVIWENVKNVLSKKHKPVFDAYVDEMKNMGYNTYYKVLNAKNYGIPQNRDRIYAISVREDIDNNPNYTGHTDHNKYYDKFNKSLFPEPFDNGLRLRDFLENEVEEKYYLSDKMVSGFLKHNENHEAKGTGFKWQPRDINGIATCLRANAALAPTDNTIKCEGLLDIRGNEQVRRVYNTDYLSPTLNTMEGGNRQPKVLVREATKKGYAEAYDGDSINLEQPNSTTRRGRVGKQCAQTLTTSPQQATLQNMRIRKLTSKECYRLMGFSDEDFEKAKAVNSNSQLYKQAGNSIVVNVLEEIYKCLHNAYPNDFTKGMNVMSLFSGIGAFEKALKRVDFD